jgi:hypothetical protein
MSDTKHCRLCGLPVIQIKYKAHTKGGYWVHQSPLRDVIGRSLRLQLHINHRIER